MPDMHVIRLRGPWEFEPLARVMIVADGTRHESTDDRLPPGRVRLPADWSATLGHEFRGRVRYTRRFGLPTNLEPHEQVWLVVEGVDYFGTLSLNGQSLGEVVGYQKPKEFDVRGLLADRNHLTLDIELPQCDAAAATAAKIERPGREHLPGGPIGEVRLEIRPN
jgi:beta-galactosidase/beta-glucuronidase